METSSATVRHLKPVGVWTRDQDFAIASIRKAGYMPVIDALRILVPKMWGNVKVPHRVNDINQRLKTSGVEATVIWGNWRKIAEQSLYDAVTRGRLSLYAWPAELRDSGYTIDSEPGRGPIAIHPSVIVAVRPLHNGLPTLNIGYRPTQLRRFRMSWIGTVPPADWFVVLKRSEFSRWLKEEKRRGLWRSQAGRGHKSRSVGRPRLTEEISYEIYWRCEYGQITPSTVAAEVTRALNDFRALHKLKLVSEDTVARAMDLLFRDTSDERFKRSRRHKREMVSNTWTGPH